MASYVTAKTYANPWPAEGEPEYSETEEPPAALASALRLLGQPAAVQPNPTQCIAALRANLPE